MKEKHKERIFYMVSGAVFTITVLLLAFIIKYNTYIHTRQDENNNKEYKKNEYSSSVVKNECYLCGDNKNSTLLSHWGEHNIGMINLNTFEYFIFELNRYDDNKNPIEEKVKFSRRTGYQKWTEVGGSTMNYSYDVNRGYFTGRVSIDENTPLKADKLISYVCTDCLNSIMDQLYFDEPYCDIAFLDFTTRKIGVFTKNGLGLQLSDYQIVYHYDKEYNTFYFDGFYCPTRYSKLGLGYNNDSTVFGIINEYCTVYQIPLEIDNELAEFIAGLISIHSIQKIDNRIAFEELTNEGFKKLCVYNDGTYEIENFN